MAHVKVVRRSMRPEEWTDLRFGWLQRGIYEEMAEITELTILDARQIAENEYEYTDGGERPLKNGDLYFTPDGTAFIKGHAVIPPQFQGRDVYFSLKTAENQELLPVSLIFEKICMLSVGLRSLGFFVYNENEWNFIWIRSVYEKWNNIFVNI